MLGPRAKTILIIDDQTIARQTIRSQLEYYGYTVLEGTDGMDGLKVFRQDQTRIGLVLLDLTLPDISGEDVLAQLRAIDPTVKVAVCTEQPVTEIKSRDEFKEVVGVLRKPVRTDRLLAVARKGLDA